MITGNLHFGKEFKLFESETILKIMSKKLLPIPQLDEESEPLTARVNQGRWIVDCECGGAELMWEEGYFMCLSCFNGGYGHKYRRTVFPGKRAAIEKLLLLRPLANRNWESGESLAKLRAENEVHKEEMI